MSLKRNVEYLIFTISLGFIIFHLYTALFGVVSGVGQKALHIGIVLVIFYLKESIQQERAILKRSVDIILMLFAASGIAYLIYIDPTIDIRSGIVYISDVVFGLLFIIALVEATRRSIGMALSIVTGCFVAYAFLGKYMPFFLRFGGMNLKRFISVIYLGSDGIFGTALYASSAYIVLFIILGAIFQETGVGDLFTDLATIAFGKYKGGPAKVAVVASGFFGSISGSAIANVIGTGTFTIPMMEKVGFEPEYAGAVEAAASTGGQIMPPVMGATAFLIAEILNISYFDLVRAAFIPAVLYYFAILMTVHFNAHKNGIEGVEPSKLPDKRLVLKKIYLMTPLVVLLIMLGYYRFTISRAGMICIFLTVGLVSISKDTRINRERFVKIVNASLSGTMPVAVACALVGIITGVIMSTGLGFRLSNILLDLSGGNMMLLLILTMIASLVMGMGMPTTAAYMVLAILVAPTLIKMGVNRIASHLFILYFGIISNITPPVALAAYAAAGIAKCNPTKTGIHAFKLAISGFILPFMFIYNPYLLLEGEWHLIILAIASALLGVTALSAATERFFFRWRTSILETVLLTCSAFLLIDPSPITDVIGLTIFAGIWIYHSSREKTSQVC